MSDTGKEVVLPGEPVDSIAEVFATGISADVKQELEERLRAIEQMERHVPPGARIVQAYGQPSEVSLSDEVKDMPPERHAAFQAGLQELYDREVELAIEDREVQLF